MIRITPTLIDRLILIHQHGNITIETFNKILSCFQKKFLRFLLVPGVTKILCIELLNRHSSIAIKGLHQLFLNHQQHLIAASLPLPDNIIELCGYSILNTLRSWREHQEQYHRLRGSSINSNNSNKDVNNDMNNTENQTESMTVEKQQQQQVDQLEKYFVKILGLDDELYLSTPVSISNGVNRNTLFEKTRSMFRYIVKSGRSMYMNDVDGDIKTLWEPTDAKLPKQIVSHYLDMVLFQTALKMGGIHWFLLMIVDEVLEAGKSGGAIRAGKI